MMQSSDVTRAVQGLLAGACVVASSVCFGAAHIVSYSRIKGVIFATGSPKEAYFAASAWLFIFGGALLIAALVLGNLALVQRPKAVG